MNTASTLPKGQEREPRTPLGARYDFCTLCLASYEELEKVMRMGTLPNIEELVGWEYKGWNTTDLAYLINNKKFKKGFYRNIQDGRVCGYNVVVLQNNLGEPWIEKLKGAGSIKHGWFDVYPVKLDEIDAKYPNALLLNYGREKRNSIFNPARMLRDYLVQVYPDNPDLYLGKAFLAVGPMRIFQSYFILEKNNRSLM